MSQSRPENSKAVMDVADACSDMVRNLRARGMRSTDADDAAQDACVRVLQLETPQAVKNPVRYLIRVAHNLFIDRQRHRKRETAIFGSLTEIDSEPGDGVDPERILAGKQDLERVLAAVAKLPPRCREAFTLHRFHGLSYAAIARRMAISTSTVEKHIAEAMLRITRAVGGTEENVS